jgi:hypothetical protein
MSLPADYHMHTPLCRHAVGEPTEYAAHAIKLGLTATPDRAEMEANHGTRFSRA